MSVLYIWVMDAYASDPSSCAVPVKRLDFFYILEQYCFSFVCAFFFFSFLLNYEIANMKSGNLQHQSAITIILRQ